MATKSTKSTKGYKGIGMEGVIATWYANNALKQMEDYKKDARRVAEEVDEGSTVLELAPGPGYLSIELAKLGNYQITGLDISEKFVEIARSKARQAGMNIDFRHGDASQMPFKENTFDFIICRAAFKNFAHPIQALNEINRVLKVGGKALIIDLRRDVSQERMDNYVKEEMNLSGVNRYLTKWIFRYSLLKRAYTKDEFEKLVAKSHFQSSHIDENTIGLEIGLKKS